MKDYLRLVGNQSLPEELEEGWEKWVCEPIIKYPLAPRWGKVLLEVFGLLASQGISVEEVVRNLSNLTLLKYKGSQDDHTASK